MKSTHKVALLLILKAAVMAWLLVYPAKGRAQQIRHDNASNITISGKNIIAGDKPAIELNNCINIHITLSRFTKGKGVNGIGIKLYKCTNVTIDSCNFEDLASGVLASLSTGVYIANNQMKNMLGPMPRGQFVQFIECYGAGNKITQNRMENLPGKSFPEDAINIYKKIGRAHV